MANSSASCVRSVIELFCKILSENVVHDPELHLRAETLRQAKFNNPAATSQLWHLLHNSISYCRKKSVNFKPSAFQLSDNVIASVKSQLQNWGFFDQPFANLSLKTPDCSRHLLLALGWMMHKRKLFDLVISRRCNPLHETLGSFIGTEDETSHTLFREPKNQRSLSQREQLQVQVLLCGKLHQTLKRLYATHQLHTALRNKITESTKGVNLQADLDHLTVVEVYLLKNKTELKKMMTQIETDNEQLKSLLEWKEKESIFWEWMDSVLTLHIEERMEVPRHVAEDEQDQVFLSVPANIGQEITETRAKLRDLILSHEDHIELMEKLVVSKRIPKSDLQWMSLVLEREVAQLSHSLAHCGHGLGNEDNVEDFKPAEDLENSESNTLSRQQGRIAVKNAQSQERNKKVKEKIEDLQQKVDDLELELRNLQAQHLQKLQVHVSQDPSIICIQPTTLKHFFKS